DLMRLVTLDPHRAGRTHRDLGRADGDAGGLDRLLHRLELSRGRVHDDERPIDLDILRAAIDRDELYLVGRSAVRFDLDHALLLEEPLDRTGFAELASGPGERGTHLRGGAVPVVRGRFDHGRDPARGVALVHDALDLRAVATAGGALDRSVDVR